MLAGMIHVSGLCKAYEDRIAVRDLSFTVAAGEVLGLVGPNGAGKTTTLRAIAGIHPPTSGSLRVAGHDIVDHPVAAKSRLAMIPDDPHLFSSLTVWEHLEFTAQVYRIADFAAAAEPLLQRLELLDRRDSLADELSRGMRQKVAVACALLHEPDVLLLDEPMTGLDPRGIRTLFEAIRTRAAAGAAAVISSHLLGQIEPLCTRFLIMNQGECLFLGSRAEIGHAMPGLREDASLEEIFFEATEGRAARES
jgi:ABC-2 type transport system ATP-binding protein